MRKKNRPMSSRTAGRVANYSKPTVVPAGNLLLMFSTYFVVFSVASMGDLVVLPELTLS